MKFRTEIKISPFATSIDYADRLLALGSCFSEHIAHRLAVAKFRVAANPSGILFNPLSLAATLQDYVNPTPIDVAELCTDGERWFHYGFHGDFAAPTLEEAKMRMDAARQQGAEALAAADWLLLTFGTAWVYERQGQVVANCHRQPATEFQRRRLSVSEIVERFAELLNGPLAEKRVVLTVSPVRHVGDGLAENNLSKAILRLAAEELSARFEQVEYFPAYEILMDDLRDYRFYADDLVHPSSQAVAYVWEKFVDAALSTKARQLLPEVEAVVAAASHRPRNERSESHKEFCRRCLEKIAALPEIDFSEEAAAFRRSIEINS